MFFNFYQKNKKSTNYHIKKLKKILTKYIIIAVVIVLAFAFMAFRNVSQQNSCFENLSPAEFKKMLEEQEDVVLLDVRTDNEFNSGHIQDAKNVNYFASNFRQKIKEMNQDKTYLVYCRSGGRSAKACNILCQEGMTKVYNLSGGILAWK